MRTKDGFELRVVCGEHILIAHGEDNIDFTKVISFNESAAFLWTRFEGREFSEEDMVNALCEEYEVKEAQALEDVHRLVDTWREAGVLKD